jgi:D-alanyl-D-alanine carboxypeptidase/D-alanyl-D-alanine-endopeptidase (penicillin-binding protein 4)
VNLYAEHLIKAMGQGTTTLGTKAVTQFWNERGVVTGGMNMVDGSGLSRKNFITAKQLATILVEMKKSSHFYASLPEEMPGVFAKSGSMSFTRCLAGYKGDIAFAIMINYGDDSKEMEKKLDKLVTELH